MNRKLLSFLAGAALAVFTASLALAGGLPTIPPTSRWSEPSQLLNTLNTFIRTLNGESTAINSASGNWSLGHPCTASSATTAVTCNGARGVLTLTGIPELQWGASSDVTLTNTNVDASSACTAQVLSSTGATGSALTVATAIPTQNTLTIRLVNGGSISTGSGKAYTVGFQCFQ
jgi:hypothetical protein